MLSTAFLYNFTFIEAVTCYEMGFMYESKRADEFEDMESYIKYKMEESESIADHPINRIHSDKDYYRYLYFTGKAVAYRDCLKSSIE
jgi:hypothetical protein